MLKRVLYVGEEKKHVKAIEKAASAHGNLRVEQGLQGSPGTVGVLAGPGEFETAISALAHVAREYDALFTLLSEAIDAREGHVHGSCARLCDHAIRLGKALKLSHDDLQTLERGALLHDIGKLRVSNDVLMKKSLLTYDEWIELRAHTTKGADLLREHGFEEGVIEIVQFHHEAWDGDGYPEHREQEAIPLLARIMKICDVFTAMTSPRHYRPGIPSIDDALAHLKDERGKHFDPALVDAFLDNNIGQPWPTA